MLRCHRELADGKYLTGEAGRDRLADAAFAAIVNSLPRRFENRLERAARASTWCADAARREWWSSRDRNGEPGWTIVRTRRHRRAIRTRQERQRLRPTDRALFAAYVGLRYSFRYIARESGMARMTVVGAIARERERYERKFGAGDWESIRESRFAAEERRRHGLRRDPRYRGKLPKLQTLAEIGEEWRRVRSVPPAERRAWAAAKCEALRQKSMSWRRRPGARARSQMAVPRRPRSERAEGRGPPAPP